MEQMINAKEVLSSFDKAINKLEKDFQPQLLSNKEKINVGKELNEVIRLGLKVKLQYQQRKIDALIKSLDGNQEIDLVKIQLMSNELERVLRTSEAA